MSRPVRDMRSTWDISAADHHVINRSGILDSQLPGHAPFLDKRTFPKRARKSTPKRAKNEALDSGKACQVAQEDEVS